MSDENRTLESLEAASFAGSASRVGLGSRSEVLGCRAALAVGHHFVANVGMDILKLGGNAIDAGVAMTLAANVVEFTSCGFGGEVPTLIYSAREQKVVAVNGNTRAPLAARPEWWSGALYRVRSRRGSYRRVGIVPTRQGRAPAWLRRCLLRVRCVQCHPE